MRNLPARFVPSMVVLLVAAGAALGQAQNAGNPSTPADPANARPPSSPEPSKTEKARPSELEQMLTEALVNNPDIRVAEAKLREAEAELSRVRLQTLQKLTSFHHSLDVQRAAVKRAEDSLHEVRNTQTTQETVQRAETLLSQEKAKLATLENELPMLLGRPPQTTATDRQGSASADFAPHNFFTLFDVTNAQQWGLNSKTWRGRAADCSACHDASGWKALEKFQQFEAVHRLFLDYPAEAASQGALADKIRKALDTPVTVDLKDVPLSAALHFFEEKMPGISFHNALPRSVSEDMKVTLHLHDVPVGAALQALEDTFTDGQMAHTMLGGLRLAVREYGILVTTRGQIPPGATLLHDFWKGRTGAGNPKGDALADKSGDKSAPPEDIEGRIKATDPKNSMVTINIGSDAGLRKGHTLEVYRLKPQPMYLGSIEILSVTATEAVARPVRNSRAKLEVGDHVTVVIRRR